MITANEVLNELKKPEAIDEEILGQNVQDVVDGLGSLASRFRKTGAKDSADAMTAMKKEFMKVLKNADQETEKFLLDLLKPFKFKEFTVPFIGKAKVTNINASGGGYFVELQSAPGVKFNISHRENGSWDSRLDIKDKEHKQFPGGYGPQGQHKFPDFSGIMKKLSKGIR